MTLSSGRLVRWATAVMVAVVLLIVARLLYRERETLLAFPWTWNIPFLVLSWIMHGLTMVGTFYVWRTMLRRLSGTDSLAVRPDFSIYFTTTLAKRIPGTVWYAAGRVWLYERLGIRSSPTLAALVLEMAVIYLSGVVFVLLLLPVSVSAASATLLPLGQTSLWLGALILGCGTLIVWPGALERVINLARRRLGRDEVRLTVGPRDLMVWLAVDLLVWVAAGLGFYGVVGAVYPVGPADVVPLMLICAIGVLAGAVTFLFPFLPVVKEATITVLLATMMPAPVALVIAILFRIAWTVYDALWALVASRVWQPQERQA